MSQWELDAKEFSTVLKQMKQFSKGRSGDASWVFEDGKLRIEWSGMGMGLAAPGERPAVIQVDANDMGQLVRMPMQGTGKVVVKVEEGRLRLGSLSIPCKERRKPVKQLLPVNARPREVALLPFMHSPEEIADADLTAEVEAVEERKRESIEHAARSLSWLGIEAKHLAPWIDAHLEAVAHGRATFSTEPKVLVVDQKGQVNLFDK